MTPSPTYHSRKGDAKAFAALMEMHQSRLYRIAYTYLHNADDALEAIQESTYRAYHTATKIII